jgi:hypothetical protein
MLETTRFRFRTLGIALSLIGLSLPVAVVLLVFAGVRGPFPLLEGMFWGGLGLPFVGVGIVILFRKRT